MVTMGKLTNCTYTTTMAKFRAPRPSIEKHRPTFPSKTTHHCCHETYCLLMLSDNHPYAQPSQQIQ